MACLVRRLVSMIELDGVTKIYKGEVLALYNISCAIAKGDFVFLVGPSGSGKSTLLKLLHRQEKADHGSIWIAGREIGSLPKARVPRLRRIVGCIFQDYKLLPNKTVVENVAFALEVTGSPRSAVAEKVHPLLELVGLSRKLHSYPNELSGGEQQRVSIARAFVNRPPILLADEPTGNLDPDTSLGIMRILDEINRRGTTILMATHDSGLVNHARRRVIRLDKGRLVQDQAQGQYHA